MSDPIEPGGSYFTDYATARMNEGRAQPQQQQEQFLQQLQRQQLQPQPQPQQQQMPENLLRELGDYASRLSAHMGSGGNPAVMASFVQPPSYFVLIMLTLSLSIVAFIISEMANYLEIKNKWDEYRCMPSVAPFASFYGHNLSENMNFCVSQSVKEHAPGVINPIYDGINVVSNTVEGVFGKVAAIEKGVGGLLSGFQTFVINFINSFGLIGTRIRMALIRIKDIFSRVYGTFVAFVYAAISTLVFGENLVCNPLVAFLGTIMGYDTCCFAPDTEIVMADGSWKPIAAVRIGDVLQEGATVTSLYEFDGSQTPMVSIDGIHVSDNHYLVGGDGAMVQAGQHPAATPAPSLTRLWCLGTSDNRIPVFSRVTGVTRIFTDYEESEDADVIAEVQAIAEKELNGDTSVVGEPVLDYSLGLDPAYTVLLKGGVRKRLEDLQIGDELVGGGTVSGVIREECESLRIGPGGFAIASAQLVYFHGKWKRSQHIFPRLVSGPRILCQLMVTNNAAFTVVGHALSFLVRDYAEVTVPEMQAPYDKKVTSLRG